MENMGSESHERKAGFTLFRQIARITETGPISCIVLVVYFVFITALEFIAFWRGGFASVLASRIWLSTAILLFLLFILESVNTLVSDIRNKKFLLAGAFIVLLLFFCRYIGDLDYSDINPDATQQLAAGLDSFKTPDLNYTGTAFLGYANRQYVLAALPARILGRSIATLHMGFAVPFLVGLTMLFLEFRKWCEKYSMNEELALIPCFAFPGFRFITEYYMNFEQAITPVALTMIGTALFLRIYRKPAAGPFLALSWVGCFLSDSYTPSLASLGLLIAFLLLFFIEICIKKRKNEANEHSSESKYLLITISALIANIVLFFVATLMAERSDRLSDIREEVSVVKLALESWEEFFMDKNAIFLGIFSGIVILYMLLALLGRLKIQDFLIAGWVLGVIFFANYMQGYSTYKKPWIMQRNMIIIPVLIAGIFLAVLRWMKKNTISPDLISRSIILLMLAGVGLLNFRSQHQSFDYFRYVQPIKYLIYDMEMTLDEYGIDPEGEFSIVLYTDNSIYSNIGNYSVFFFPNARTYSESGTEYADEIEPDKLMFFYAEDERLESFFDKDIEKKQFHNERYDLDITWFKKVPE